MCIARWRRSYCLLQLTYEAQSRSLGVKLPGLKHKVQQESYVQRSRAATFSLSLGPLSNLSLQLKSSRTPARRACLSGNEKQSLFSTVCTTRQAGPQEPGRLTQGLTSA